MALFSTSYLAVHLIKLSTDLVNNDDWLRIKFMARCRQWPNVAKMMYIIAAHKSMTQFLGFINITQSIIFSAGVHIDSRLKFHCTHSKSKWIKGTYDSFNNILHRSVIKRFYTFTHWFKKRSLAFIAIPLYVKTVCKPCRTLQSHDTYGILKIRSPLCQC